MVLSRHRALEPAFASQLMTNTVNGWDGHTAPPRPFT
jgi:hypothetical protein